MPSQAPASKPAASSRESLTMLFQKALSKPFRLFRRTGTRRNNILRALCRVGTFVLLLSLILQYLLAYQLARSERLLPSRLQKASNVLLVTAHPDDECLFFSPTVLGLLDRNPNTKGALLVMSTGNNYGIGETRKQELLGSCLALGIVAERCVALDRVELQDSPTTWWNTTLIEHIVADYVVKWQIDAVITFDQGGVSGHINHRAVSAGVRDFAVHHPDGPIVYALVTTSLPRKYSFILDLPLTALSFAGRILGAFLFRVQETGDRYAAKALLVNTWRSYMATRRAFASHDSQYSWDRNLYMVVSRYVWFNDLKRMN